MAPIDLTEAFRDLVHIGISLTSERDLATLLERILTEARGFTRAEAGTLFLRTENELERAAVQNDRLGGAGMGQRAAGQPLKLTEMSLAAYVALSGEVLNVPDVDVIPSGRPYAFNPAVDAQPGYETKSALVVPLQDPKGSVAGVLELINAVDETGSIVAFDPVLENLARSLASQATVAIRNARLEDLSFKDPLTDVYNRRYFMVRLEEESKRHTRFSEPVSLVLLDLDHFKDINDEFGHRAGDEALKEVARLLQRHSRNFTVVTRYGGDEFAILLVNTSKAGGIIYAERIREMVETHEFAHGAVTVSLGVASLPEDADNGEDLVHAADGAMYTAKRAGRNRVVAR